jgi:thiol-disulfide isomerase/thioredoxin
MQSSNPPEDGRTTRREVLAGAAALVVGAAGFGRMGEARAAHVTRPWPATRPTPALELTDLGGKVWSLASLKGRPVLLNFWASWCEPCRAEMPSLERLAAKHGRTKLVVLTVNYQEPEVAIRRFLEARPVGLPILLDPEGDAAGLWTPRVFPSTVLIDQTGAARITVVGELDWSGPEAHALIEPLLVTPRNSAPR